MSFIERGKGPWPANNQLHTVQRWIALRLGGKYEDREIQSVTRVLLDAVSRLDRGQRIVNDWQPNESALDTLARCCDRFKEGEPLQYILGESHFLGLTLSIDSRALIPRPETEELVRHLLGHQLSHEPQHVLDIGTGSGCMALGWKSQRPKDHVTGADVSINALELARENAIRLGYGDLDWIKCDVRAQAPFTEHNIPNGGWDVIMSNPPYIPVSEKETMEDRVVSHEPADALFVADNDPLCFYRAIAVGCMSGEWLHAAGWLGFECHRDHADDVASLLSTQPGWCKVQIMTDLQGSPRMVVAQKD
ncbi:MAG: peptide chain release factor N(5)-glutamine methyltransferase [Flavobacteriales bacterium]|nr:peptide chain release factor N(5)-glutamine methyltransferase [Flavobacteriales bacterium]